MLSDKALLVYLSISQWTGRKLDHKATGSVETNFSTQSKVGNYTKKLLPGAKQLEAIQSQAGAIRKFYYDNTLPWMTDGSRILSSKNYLDFVHQFQSKKNEFDQAIGEFIAEYPALRNQAKIKLGNLFNELEYPNELHLRNAFQCEVSFLPLPDVSDFRTEILDSERDGFLTKMRDVETQATKECFQRLRDVVTKAAEKLSQPDATFRDSLINNISEICILLPKLDVTDNPDLDSARREVEALVATLSPDVCRSNPGQRSLAAERLTEINSKMGAFMGALSFKMGA